MRSHGLFRSNREKSSTAFVAVDIFLGLLIRARELARGTTCINTAECHSRTIFTLFLFVSESIWDVVRMGAFGKSAFERSTSEGDGPTDGRAWTWNIVSYSRRSLIAHRDAGDTVGLRSTGATWGRLPREGKQSCSLRPQEAHLATRLAD